MEGFKCMSMTLIVMISMMVTRELKEELKCISMTLIVMKYDGY